MGTTRREACAPFVKWAGGKRRLLPKLLQMLPPDVDRLRHCEPFVGGGALYFGRPSSSRKHAQLSDVNTDLIVTYSAVRRGVDGVLAELRKLARGDTMGRYYRVRARFNRRDGTEQQRAARFLYLNRTCFNGLWRVNRAGAFNTPRGAYVQPRIVDVEQLRACARALQRARLRALDFERAARDFGRGDFVYLDPPYDHEGGGFVTYSAAGFGPDDQERLADLFRELDARGARVMLSNANTRAIRRLYRGYNVRRVSCARSVAASGELRGDARELVIRNY